MKNYVLEIVAMLAVASIVSFAMYLGIVTTSEAILGLASGLAGLGFALFRRMDPPSSGPPAAPTALLILAVIAAAFAVATSCTPAERQAVPVLSTVDAVGKTLSRVAGWCEDARGGSQDVTLARAKEALARGDGHEAVKLLSEEITALRLAGLDVPDEAFAMLKLAEYALAADAIAEGMRALSTPADR